VSILVFLSLLAAAALHAGWNALLRRETDRDVAAVAIAGGGTVVGLAVVPFVPALAPEAIPFVLGSSCIHVLYYFLVASAYRHGELSIVYPIMRGLAPLIVTIVSAFFIEPASPVAFAGVAIVTAGIVSLGAEGFGKGRAGIGFAVLNAFVIASYTIVDGLGARASLSPGTYTAWILVGGGIATVGWRLIIRGRGAIRPIVAHWPVGLAGGVMGYGAYAIALWAMTIAPIGAVAAVRETAVLFATVLGAVLLHERFGALRWLAAVLVVIGLALVKLG
jgi:drug/metabolite transporter (DMT)-like permease